MDADRRSSGRQPTVHPPCLPPPVMRGRELLPAYAPPAGWPQERAQQWRPDVLNPGTPLSLVAAPGYPGVEDAEERHQGRVPAFFGVQPTVGYGLFINII
jgi:hypothetical protein